MGLDPRWRFLSRGRRPVCLLLNSRLRRFIRIYSVHDSLFEAVHPLIEAIGAYAGCYISLIAGSPPKDDYKGFFTA